MEVLGTFWFVVGAFSANDVLTSRSVSLPLFKLALAACLVVLGFSKYIGLEGFFISLMSLFAFVSSMYVLYWTLKLND